MPENMDPEYKARKEARQRNASKAAKAKNMTMKQKSTACAESSEETVPDSDSSDAAVDPC